MHCKQGASVSWVIDLKLDIEKIESSTCSAIEAASRMQAGENLDLEGLCGGDLWDPYHFTGSASRDFLFKPRECTLIVNEEGQLLLFCSRMWSLTNGFERNGVSLQEAIGRTKLPKGLNVRALVECMNTGGFPVGVGKLRVYPYTYFAPWGYTSGQLSAFIEADPKAKEELVKLLTEYSNQFASQQVEITLFDNDDKVVGVPSLHDSCNAGIHNRDKNKVTIPNLPRSMAHDGSRTITVEMIHEGTIDTKGEGLWIPKSSKGGKPLGRWLIRFTGVTTTHGEVTRKGKNKRKRSELDSDSDSDSD